MERISRVRKLSDALRTFWYLIQGLPTLYSIVKRDRPWKREYVKDEQQGPQLAIPSLVGVAVSHRIHSGFSFIVPPKTAQNVHGTGFALTFYNTSNHEMSIDMNTSVRAIVSEPDPIEPLFDETEKDEINENED